jgi:hypothetical protein
MNSGARGDRPSAPPSGPPLLVLTQQNLCILSRKTDECHCGPSAMWDVGADTFKVDFEGGVDFLEHADLSPDEPELEERVFEDLGPLGLAEDAEPTKEE